MVMIDQQVEDRNYHDLKEAELKQVMIRLYKEIKSPMIPADLEDDNKNGSGGSRSSIDEFARIFSSTDIYHSSHLSQRAEMELTVRNIYKETICTMMCADIKAMQMKFLSVIKDHFGVDLSPDTTWNIGNAATTLAIQSLELQFLNGIPASVSTRENIKGNDHKPISVALVDGISGKIVTTGPESAIDIEIVVLEGDCNDDEAKNWSSVEFNNKIVSKWNGKKALQGNTFVKMKKGIVSVGNISFTQNSSWKGKRKFRMGARSVNAVLRTHIKEAKTELFLVTDKRNLLYSNNPNPSLSDPVYRLNKISKRGDCFKRLSKANIRTVMDILTLHAINPKRLKDILDVSPNVWKLIISHAQACEDDRGIYLCPYPRNGQNSDGVLFNISGNLVGIIAESQFVSCEMLPHDKRDDAEKLMKSSSRHWEEVISSNDRPSLLKHLQIQLHTTFNSFHNSLNIVIPHTVDPHDQTNLTSPHTITPCPNSQVYVNDGFTYPVQSQRPKRPASEHTISNSPKKPRDSRLPATPSVGASSRMTYTNLLEDQIFLSKPEEVREGDSCMQYPFIPWEFDNSGVGTNLNHSVTLSEEVNEYDDYLQYSDLWMFDNPSVGTSRRTTMNPNNLVKQATEKVNEVDKWKMLYIAVGWISRISKERKRRMAFVHDDTLIVISASIG